MILTQNDSLRPLLPTDEDELNSQIAKKKKELQENEFESLTLKKKTATTTLNPQRSASNKNVANMILEKKATPVQKALTDTHNFIQMRSKDQNKDQNKEKDEGELEGNDTSDQVSLDSINNTLNGLTMADSFKKRKDEWAEKGAAKIIQEIVDPETGQTTKQVIKKGIKDFKFGEMIGDGAYSTVLLATSIDSGKKYAVKVLNKEYLIRQKKVKYVNIEKIALQRLNNSRSIIRLFFTFQDEASLYFLLEYAPNGDFLSVMKKYGSLNEECACYYGAQILDAIGFMHTRGIIHRDIKPENILMDKDMKVKITDFGTAKILDEKTNGNNKTSYELLTRSKSFVGTAEYVSPELLNDNYSDSRCDIWAFGCILYQMIAGKPPFKATNEYLTFQKVMKVQYAFTAGFPTIIRDLIKRILLKVPEQRLTIGQIKSHLFFSEKNFSDDSIWDDPAPEIQPYKINAKSMQPVPQLKDHLNNKRTVIMLNKRPSPKPTAATIPMITKANIDGKSSSPSLSSDIKKPARKPADNRTKEILENARRSVNQRKQNLMTKASNGGATSAATAALAKRIHNPVRSSSSPKIKTTKSSSTTKVDLTNPSHSIKYSATPRIMKTADNLHSNTTPITVLKEKSNETSQKMPHRRLSASVSSPMLPIVSPPATPRELVKKPELFSKFMNKSDIEWSFYLKSIDEHIIKIGEFNVITLDTGLLEKRLNRFHITSATPQIFANQKTTLLSQVARSGGGVTGFRNDMNDNMPLFPESTYYKETTFDPESIVEEYKQSTTDLLTLLFPTSRQEADTEEPNTSPSADTEGSVITGKFKKLFQHAKQPLQYETTPEEKLYKRLLLLTSYGRFLMFVKRSKPMEITNIIYDLVYEIDLCQNESAIKEILVPTPANISAVGSNNLISIQTPYKSFILNSLKNDQEAWFGALKKAIKLGYDVKLASRTRRNTSSRPHAGSSPLPDVSPSIQEEKEISVALPNTSIGKGQIRESSAVSESNKGPPTSSELGWTSRPITAGNNSTNRSSRLFNAFVNSKEKTGKKTSKSSVPITTKLINGLPNTSAHTLLGLGLSDSPGSSSISIDRPSTASSSSNSSTFKRGSTSSRLQNISEQYFRPHK
ncbi:serine/threonine protein kinase PKH2 NDAI_0G04290 [Naumovozyma dairenensis CBS 421]|uniref:non-specific serine/threonine protein kinase n=1 Tax=Naumovozyma dairenensis (strain ATCC 10597 / BCRC 20456 / CBS 421 / NBRC 0211 / NRRL Y-12639) TaxID=1071378 RepID=J7RE93_NAUDC|nr:hypothetical protein NDAI_0G04290 [Naumovozyma dairenensis CBS 421]CCK73414.1 hypothetical protein NDAI_0G04290 [Naumovozyma dairenensis CBS 421]